MPPILEKLFMERHRNTGKGITRKEMVGSITSTKDVWRPKQNSNPMALPTSWSSEIKKLTKEVFE